MNIELAKLNQKKTKFLNSSISNALEFLHKNQLQHGEFRTFVSLEKEMVSKSHCYQNKSPYITTYILYSINFLSEPRVLEMTHKALSFFLEQMKNPGLWRFFTSDKRVIYFESLVGDPIGLVPDLDDTACVSYALIRNNITFDSNINIFRANKNERLLFYTWLLDKSKWKNHKDTTVYITPSNNDICCGVNANILLYLGENNEDIAVCEYLNDIVLNNEEKKHNIYFSDEIVFYYLLSRAYFNGVYSLKKSKHLIISKVLSIQKNDGAFGNVLTTALAVCTLFNFAYFEPNVSRAIEYIVNAQAKNGSWQKAAFFLDSYRYYGSEELTTAICIEALIRYRLYLTET